MRDRERRAGSPMQVASQSPSASGFRVLTSLESRVGGGAEQLATAPAQRRRRSRVPEAQLSRAQQFTAGNPQRRDTSPVRTADVGGASAPPEALKHLGPLSYL